jgi:hypothetical protein
VGGAAEFGMVENQVGGPAVFPHDLPGPHLFFLEIEQCAVFNFHMNFDSLPHGICLMKCGRFIFVLVYLETH